MPEGGDWKCPIYSIYEGNEVYQPLLSDFVHALKIKISEIDKSLQDKDMNDVARLCHKLCGSASTYGFPAIAALAKQIENSVRSEIDVEHSMRAEISIKLGYLTQMCNMVTTKEVAQQT